MTALLPRDGMVARGAAMFKPPGLPGWETGRARFRSGAFGKGSGFFWRDASGLARPAFRRWNKAAGVLSSGGAVLPRDFEALRPGLLCAGRFWGPFTGESPGAFFASSAGMRRASDARRRFFPASSAGSCARLCSVPSAGETFRIVAARCASALRRAAGRHFCVPKPGMASFFSSLASSHVATLTMTR